MAKLKKKSDTRVYELAPILDDPRFVGFRSQEGSYLETTPWQPASRKWKVKRVSRTWVSMPLLGRARKMHDFPCVDWSQPLFSVRAVEALRDFLEPNGELLPQKTLSGMYYAYNTTTIADVLNWRRSKIDWIVKPIRPDEILRFEFHSDKLRGLSIFRIPEEPRNVYVTDQFVDRVNDRGLQGFHFKLVWPIPKRADWQVLAHQPLAAMKRAGLTSGWSADGAAVMIRLTLGAGTTAESRAIDRIVSGLEKAMIDEDATDRGLGQVEPPELDGGYCTLAVSCPDPNPVVERLLPWLRKLKWPAGFRVYRRYTHFADQRGRNIAVTLR